MVKHLPGYLENLPALRAKGADVVAVLASNDPFVMSAWSKANGVKNDEVVSACCALVIGFLALQCRSAVPSSLFALLNASWRSGTDGTPRSCSSPTRTRASARPSTGPPAAARAGML